MMRHLFLCGRPTTQVVIPAQAGIQRRRRNRPRSPQASGGTNRHSRVSGNPEANPKPSAFTSSVRRPKSSFPRKRESRGAAETVRVHLKRPAAQIVIPAQAGIQRRTRNRPRSPQASGGPNRHSRVSGNPEANPKPSAFTSSVRRHKSSFPRKRESRGEPETVRVHLKRPAAQIVIPAQAGIQRRTRNRPRSPQASGGTNRHSRASGNPEANPKPSAFTSSVRRPKSSFPRKRESRGEPETVRVHLKRPAAQIVIPAQAGIQRRRARRARL